jgi:pimeloyl-ACP methyl ester carboxylesterase
VNLESGAGGGLHALYFAAIYAQLEACLLLVNPLGMDPAALASGGRSALSHYGLDLDNNDPAHPPVPADPSWRPRLTDADKADARAQLVAARAAFVLQKKRDENWARRRVFLQTLLAGGLRHSAAQKAEQAALQAAVDTSAVLSDVPRDREYLKQQVLGHEGVVRRVASFL